MSPKDVISEATKIPLSLLFAAIGTVALIVLWAKGLEAKVENHEATDDARVVKIESRLDSNQVMFQEIRDRLSRIEGKLQVK